MLLLVFESESQINQFQTPEFIENFYQCLVRNKSMQEGLLGFLKHVGSFPKLFKLHTLQNVSSFILLTCALKSPAIKVLSYVLE